jgi:acetylornithine deacetylase
VGLAAEEDVLNWIDKNKGSLLGLLERLIKIPSFKSEETAVARFLAQFFRRRGYEVDLQEVEPGRFQTIATLKGCGGGKSIMFNGHIDIDPLVNGWKRDPWIPRIEGDRMYGAGSFNMKGGVAAMISAAEALRKSGVRLRGDVVVACVAGELAGGDGTVHMLEQGVRTDMAVVAECFGTDSVATVHVGVLHMAIHTFGVTRHIRYPEGSVDAIVKMGKVLEALRGIRMTFIPRDDLPAMPVFNVGGVIGGLGRDHNLVDPYYISDFCTAIIDVHYIHGQTVDSIVQDVRRTLDPLVSDDPDLRYEIEVPVPESIKGARRRIMEPFDIPKDEFIVRSVVRNHERVAGAPPKNVGAVLPLSYSANDTCHLWKAGIPCVIYGPTGDENEPDNYVQISEMVRCAKVLALTAIDVCA